MKTFRFFEHVALLFLAVIVSSSAFGSYEPKLFQATARISPANRNATEHRKSLLEFPKIARESGFPLVSVTRLDPDGSPDEVYLLTIDAGYGFRVEERRVSPTKLEVRAKMSRQLANLLNKPWVRSILDYPPESEFCIGGSCQLYEYTIED